MQYKCKLRRRAETLSGVTDAVCRPEKIFTEIFMDRNNEVVDEKIIAAVKLVGNFKVTRID